MECSQVVTVSWGFPKPFTLSISFNPYNSPMSWCYYSIPVLQMRKLRCGDHSCHIPGESGLTISKETGGHWHCKTALRPVGLEEERPVGVFVGQACLWLCAWGACLISIAALSGLSYFPKAQRRAHTRVCVLKKIIALHNFSTESFSG